MKITKILPILVLVLGLSACGKPAGELVGASVSGPMGDAEPLGMRYIRKGSFLMGANDQSAIFAESDENRKVSVNAFWMDETEITNSEYRQFVHWVRDSIARTLLIENEGDDSRFALKDNKGEVLTKKMGDDELPRINWSEKIPWENRGDDAEDNPMRDVYDSLFYEGGAGVLYNGMLKSLIPFTAKGFLWYQGCADKAKYNLYKRLQPAFVKMLREYWGDDKMPFYFAQIAPYKYDDPDGRVAGFMMWAQAQTLEMIPYSGMATTHDAGEFDCIHPANKKAVGDRLAYLALTNDYGIKGIDAKAPMPKEIKFENGAAIVEFECGDLGVGPINKELVGSFELAGEDKVFYPAVAKLEPNRRSIKVTSDQVPAPVAIRYGMRNWSEALIFNNFGVPASPFRSDDWDN